MPGAAAGGPSGDPAGVYISHRRRRQEEQLLGTLSQRFEASGPGSFPPERATQAASPTARISSPAAATFPGLLPVVSVLLRYILPLHRNRLAAAYEADGGYGSSFDATWRALANEDSDGFMRVQRNYVRRSYYDPIVRSIESAVPGFDMDNYSIALRNVFWSRAVQHGVGGSSGFSSSDAGAAPPASLCGLRRSGRLCQSA